ncbi:MAG: hypothetical protein Q7V63_09950 [Gammaproteobacteria bacterium]|nr:hypothetical protein [Gammaproteobacteria bacterium]
MIYGYAARSFNLQEQIADEVKRYARNHGLPLQEMVQDQAGQKVKWQYRHLATLLRQMQDGDSLIIYEAADIGLDFEQVAKFLGKVVDKEIKVHFIKYDKIFYGTKHLPTDELIDLMRHIESDFIALAAVCNELAKFSVTKSKRIKI